MLGLASSLVKGGASLLTFVKDNLKLYLDFKSSRSDTLAFPSEGSTEFVASSSQYITIPNSSSLAFADGQGFSASIWFKTSTSSEMYLFDNRSGNAGFAALLNASGDNYLGYANDGTNQVTFTNQVDYNDGNWHHFAFTWNGTETLTSYIDGVAVGTGTQASLGAVDGGDLIIGKPTASDTKYWNGKMANLAIWSRCLSPEEVQSVMNKSYSQLGSVEKTSLVSWWALDNTEHFQSNISTFMNALSPNRQGTWDLTDGVITISSHNAYLYTSSWVSATGASSSTFIRLTFTAKKISGSAKIEYKGFFLDLTTDYQTFTIDTTNETGGNNFVRFPNAGSGTEVKITKLDAQYYGSKDSHGSNNGSNQGGCKPSVSIGLNNSVSLYGGNSPTLPRAIDIAESFADAIGNGSASFDGDDDFIQVDNITLPNLEPYTITAWIKTTDVDQTQAIVLWGDQASYERRALILYNGGNGSDWTLVASTNGNNAQGDTTVTEGEWTHASITVTPSTKAYKIYMNGILDGSGTFSNSLVAFSNSTLLIGKSYYGEFFEGNISGVGIWYGELTQEKIQSVMESTSYAKIPASVKSTLGSELVTSITNSTSNPWETFSGASGNTLASATNDAGTSGEMFSQQLGLSADTLVKVTVTVTLNAGTIKAQFCAADGSFTSGDLNEIISTSGTHSFYAIISASSKDILWIKHQTSPLDISNLTLSVKEVTNDLVAYYPLDAGENSNMSKDYTIADSLMTFGDNLLADGDAGSDGWTNDTGGTNPPAVNEKSSEYAKEGTFSRKFVADGGTDAVNTPTFTTETGATYQVSFWIRPNSTSQNFYIYQGDGSGTNTFIAEATSTTWLRSYTANQWNKLVGYFTESGGGSNAYLQFESPSSSDATYYIDEVKVKKVLSGNYGRLL